MKREEIEMHKSTLKKIARKLADINVHLYLRYGLSNEEKSFLEIVNELVDDLNENSRKKQAIATFEAALEHLNNKKI